MISPNRVFVGAVIVAVALAVGIGLFLVGSPGDARQRRLDDRRVEDLQGLSFAVDQYAREQRRLPRSLTELGRGPGRGVDSTDPMTRQAYGYRVIDPTHYELCAAFERSSDDDLDGRGRWPRDREWAHAAGRQCFRRTIHDPPR